MKMLLTAIATLLLIGSAAAKDDYEMTKEQVAKLPQDKVQAIQQQCARMFKTNYTMRIYCESEEFKALKTYIDRNGTAD
jgi:hypothetical protein